jgi:hypothetical protein
MRKEIRNFIEWKIKEGIKKEKIIKELNLKYKEEDYKWIIFEYPEPELIKKNKIINNILIIALWIILLFKLILLSFTMWTTSINAYLLWPILQITLILYIIKLLLNFRYMWYVLVYFTSIMSIQPLLTTNWDITNPILIDLWLTIFLIILTSFLFYRLHWETLKSFYK